MIFPVIEKEEIISAILHDGSYQGDHDWWTGHVDLQGNVYDINVYGDEFDDILKEDERAVSVYAVDPVTLETDYCDSTCFVLKLKDLNL
jgi:hypothetical protein